MVVVKDPASDSDDILRQKRSRDRKYAFDHAFGPETTQEDLYSKTTSGLIDGVVHGFNATVFAYGATGAGKTFTMLGTPTKPGIMILTLRDMFKAIEGLKASVGLLFKVSLSYVEVYNENIRDLLVGGEESLDLREDPIKGPTVAGVSEVLATNTEEIMSLLAKGNRNRRQEPTAANKESSRSHAVLQIMVEQRERNGTNLKVGKLSLIDLAGSERASNTQNRGIRLKEGANINRSLLALGNCINALGQNAKGSFVPYRDSKLTRLLKDSLGGNCRTVMIANIAPNSKAFDETLNTLKYANRAKNIKTRVSRNVVSVSYHISEYENLIKGLRSEISVLKGQLGHHGGPTPALLATRSLSSAAAGGAEQSRVDGMRDLLVQNFQERMQLRRSLIELQAQNVQNKAEITRRQVDIARWEDAHRGAGIALRTSCDSPVVTLPMGKPTEPPAAVPPAAAASPRSVSPISTTDVNPEPLLPATPTPAPPAAPAQPPLMQRTKSMASWASLTPDDVDSLKSEVRDLQAGMLENQKAKAELLQRLEANATQAKELHEDLATHATTDGVREMLELEYRVGILELENMELEHTRMMHQQIVSKKDQELRKHRLKTDARDRLIAEQQRVLEAHGLAHLVSRDAMDRLDAQLAEEEEEAKLFEATMTGFSMPPVPFKSHLGVAKPTGKASAALRCFFAAGAGMDNKAVKAAASRFGSAASVKKPDPEPVKFPPLVGGGRNVVEERPSPIPVESPPLPPMAPTPVAPPVPAPAPPMAPVPAPARGRASMYSAVPVHSKKRWNERVARRRGRRSEPARGRGDAPTGHKNYKFLSVYGESPGGNRRRRGVAWRKPRNAMAMAKVAPAPPTVMAGPLAPSPPLHSPAADRAPRRTAAQSPTIWDGVVGSAPAPAPPAHDAENALARLNSKIRAGSWRDAPAADPLSPHAVNKRT